MTMGHTGHVMGQANDGERRSAGHVCEDALVHLTGDAQMGRTARSCPLVLGLVLSPTWNILLYGPCRP